MEHRFARITDNIRIPVPLDCTAEEEARLVAEFRAKNDIEQLEAEAEDLAKAIREGTLVSLEELLRQLEEEETESV
jgi:hypothetical protein